MTSAPLSRHLTDRYFMGVLAKPHRRFLLLSLLLLLVFHFSLEALGKLSLEESRYSHVLFIPLISAGIVLLERRAIFQASRFCPKVGVPLLVIGGSLYFGVSTGNIPVDVSIRLSISILAIVSTWIGAFVLCYGDKALKHAVFPALFLLLMVPLPASIVERLSSMLQVASAQISTGLFTLLGVPFFRQGFVFWLPGVAIEVADECSGMRSAIALVITSTVMAYLFLKSGWKSAVLVIFAAFMAVFKNALRIVFLSCMGAYVDREYLEGKLHHQYGGMVFSVFALAFILLLLGRLRKSDGARVL